MNEEKMFHINLSKEQCGQFAFLPGDPGRVEKIAKYLDNPTFVTSNREFTTYSGFLCGEKVMVTSTGIGGPSAAIAMEELVKCGVKTFLRIGTCGGICENVMSGDLIIANSAIRMDGTSKEYLPIEFPACANFDVISALDISAKEKNMPYHIGVVQSKDSFYGQHSPETMPVKDKLLSNWDAFKMANTLGSEMECATLFSVAQVRNVRCGAILTAIWNQERRKKGLPDPNKFDTESSIKVSVNAMKILIKKTLDNF